MAVCDTSKVPIGVTLGGCFRVEAYLGEGGFGFVCQCQNTKTGERVAIKVNKSKPDVVRSAGQEIRMLRQLRCLDPEDCNIIKWNGFFFDKDRICINFELLDQSLRDYLASRNYQGLPMSELRPIVHQLTTALHHLHSLGLVHADLKPDNVMIVDREQHPLRVKLIDFGLAMPTSDCQQGLDMGTVWYRAPELILGAPFWEAIDVWSLGLTVAELAIGSPLYPGNTDYDVLKFMIETQGQPDDDLLDLAYRTPLYFKLENNSEQRWRFKTEEEFAKETDYDATETRYFLLSSLDEIEELMLTETKNQSDQRLLVDLIKRMLHPNPEERITPLEILQHPFFSESVPQSSRMEDLEKTEGIEDQTREPRQQCSWDQYSVPESSQCRVENSSADDFGKNQDMEDQTPEPRQQCSWDQYSDPESSHCRVESSSADDFGKNQDVEDQTPEPRQQCSWDQYSVPESSQCRVENSSADDFGKNQDMEDQTPEPRQQCSWDQYSDPESSHCRVENSSADDFGKNQDMEDQTSEPRQQCSWDQYSDPESSQCRVKSSSADDFEKIEDTEDQTPEPGQQCSWYQYSDPESSQCRVDNSSADDFEKNQDMEDQTREPRQQCSWDQYSDPESSHCRVESSSADDFGKNQDMEDQTPEPRQQCSWDQYSDPESSHCRVESSSADDFGKNQDVEDQTPEPRQQCSWDQYSDPESSQCMVENSSADDFGKNQDMEDQTPEPRQQCSWDQYSDPESSHCRVKNSSADDFGKNQDMEDQTPEPRQQCSWDQYSDPESSQCRVESSSADDFEKIEDTEDQTPEPGQQCSWYQYSVPESSQCRVESSSADDFEKTEDTEDETSEPFQQCSGYQKLDLEKNDCVVIRDNEEEEKNVHCRVKSSPADAHAEISQQTLALPYQMVVPENDPKEKTSTLSGQSSSCETAGAKNRLFRVDSLCSHILMEIPDTVATELSEKSLVLSYQTAVPENDHCVLEIPSADQQDVQPTEPDAGNDGWLRRLIRWVMDTSNYFLLFG